MKKLLTPDYAATSLASLDTDRLIAELRNRGIKGISFDLDDTITGHFNTWIDAAELAVLKKLSEAGFTLAINSNAGTDRKPRVDQITARLRAELPANDFFSLTSAEIGSPKPARKPYNAVASRMKLRNNQMAHMGDQLLKDHLGAARAGYGASILLIKPIGVHPGWIVQYVQRPIERFIIRLSDSDLLDI